MVVLAMAATPAESAKSLAKILKIDVDKYGFITKDIHFPTDTSAKGIYGCGFCLGPADIPESVAQASAAANRAAEVILKGKSRKSA